jgi:hypothetical protein
MCFELVNLFLILDKHQLRDKVTFWYSTFDMDYFIDNCAWDAIHLISIRQVWKFGSLHHIGSDPITRQGQFVSKHHGLRAVGSGGGYIYLDMHRPVEFCQFL